MKYLFVVLMLTGFSTVIAQEIQSEKINRFNLNEFYLYTGFNSRILNSTLQDFYTLAPQSEILKNEFTDFEFHSGIYMSNNLIYSAIIGVQFRDNETKQYRQNMQLRLGISYLNTSALTGGMYKTDEWTFDTLVSDRTGKTAYIDSIHSQFYGMRYASEQLHLDASLIFRINPEARWTFYAGMGFTAGYSINNFTEIYYNKSYSTKSYFDNDYSYTHHENYKRNFKIEVFQNKSNYSIGTNLPLGIDFRLSNKREFLKPFHLFLEFRPGITMTSIPELKTYTYTTFYHGIGVRVKW